MSEELFALENKLVGLWSFHEELLWNFNPTDVNYEGELRIDIPHILSYSTKPYKLSVDNGKSYVTIDGNKREIIFKSSTELQLLSDGKKTLTLHKKSK
jgi:hypothetical protein